MVDPFMARFKRDPPADRLSSCTSMTSSRVVSAALLLLLAIPRTVPASPQRAVGPAIVDRIAADNVTVRTVRVETPLRIDGRLDEEIYGTVQAISDFIQQEPREGEPATEKTEAWILFDDANLYIAARCWDSHPEREVANELRRDNSNILGNENFTFRARLGALAVWRLHGAAPELALHHHPERAHVDQQPGAVQRGSEQPQFQHPSALGVHRRQRTVRRL
jgi:hypothetical protein